MNRPSRVAVMLVLTLLAGCSLLVGRHDVVVYALRFAPPPQQSVGARAWQLAIAPPQAIAPYDGARIVVMPKPGEIEFYRGARWRDAAPWMLQDLLLQAYRNRVAAAPSGSGMHVDFALRTVLRDFQAEYRGASAPIVAVGLDAQLIKVADGRVVASRAFMAERRPDGTGVAEVVAAFDSATNAVLTELAGWSLDAGDAAWREH